MNMYNLVETKKHIHMKKYFIILLLCSMHINTFPNGSIEIEDNCWDGSWDNPYETFTSTSDLPFHLIQFDDFIVIRSKIQVQCIYIEIIDKNQEIIKCGNVSIGNTEQIVIPIIDLIPNEIYTIILTGSEPNNMVWSQFKK